MTNYDFFKKNGNLNIIKIKVKTPKQEAIYQSKTDPLRAGQNMPQNDAKRLTNVRPIDPHGHLENRGR